MAFLRDWGKDEQVYLQADAFGGYDGIYAGHAGGQVTEVACWAHARRKFYDARHSDPAVSTQALAYIRLLSDVEAQAKKSASRMTRDGTAGAVQPNKPVQAATSADHTFASEGNNSRHASEGQRAYAQLVAVRYRLRQELAVPRLAQFRAWRESQQAERGGPVLPKSPMDQAIQYALTQWDALCVYTNGRPLGYRQQRQRERPASRGDRAQELALRRLGQRRPHCRDAFQPDRHLPATPG